MTFEKLAEELAKTEKSLLELRKPFSPEQISKKPQPMCGYEEYKKLPKDRCDECGGYHATSKTIHLDYVGHAATTARLLEVDPYWNWEPVHCDEHGIPQFDKHGGMWIRLTVCGITRLGYGDAQGKTGPNAIKEVIGDAIRNGAMRFGVALDLWCKGELHPTVENDAPDKQQNKQKSKQHRPQGRQEQTEKAEPDERITKAYIEWLDHFKEGLHTADDLDLNWREKVEPNLEQLRPVDRKIIEDAYNAKMDKLDEAMKK